MNAITRTTAVILWLALLLGSAACNGSATTQPSSPTAATAFPVTLSHALGKTTIPAAPKRVVALGTSDVDVVYALGVEPVGIVTYVGWGAANSAGVAQWLADRVNPAQTTYVPNGPESLELVASLDPDLILLTYGSLERDVYEKLSRIAPTLAPLEGDWKLNWREQLSTIGRALGKEPEATRLETELTDRIKATATAHPEFRDRTYTFLEPNDKTLCVYLPGDPRNELIEELGLVPSSGTAALAKKEGTFFADVSFERAEDIEADVLIAYLSAFDSLSKVPILRNLPAVRSGATVTYGKADAVFQSAMVPSPLTIPVIMDRLPGDLAKALTNAPG